MDDNKESMSGLLFITHQTDSYDYLATVKLALQGGCKDIQLRMKEAPLKEVERVGKEAKEICDNYGARLYIDDHVEVCLRIGAAGVHLGKADMPHDEARKILGPDFIIGGTANTFRDIQHLEQAGVDYVGLGPMRYTTTKNRLSPVLGLRGYDRIMQQCVAHQIELPVFAIGGITSEDIPQLVQTGIFGVSVSSTILTAKDPVEETKRLIHIIHSY